MKKEEIFKQLKDNKHLLITQKKSQLKTADAIFFTPSFANKKDKTNKEVDLTDVENIGEITVKAVINSCNILDSHGDVHISGLWKKSLNEQSKNRPLYLLQEHQMKFDKIITDNLTATIQLIKWVDLGFSYDGKTECLIFDAVICDDRNPYMFGQYLSGYVKNHSVGMQYINLFLCINSDEKYYAEEKADFDKYYPLVVNKDAVDEQGYFWAVTEAKLIEGSAVPIGSNTATPTLEITNPKPDEVEDEEEYQEPMVITPEKTEPVQTTQRKRRN